MLAWLLNLIFFKYICKKYYLEYDVSSSSEEMAVRNSNFISIKWCFKEYC